MEDDKMFDLMTKIYSELQETKKEMRAGFKQVDKRFEQVDKRFEQVDKRFEQVDKRFEQVDKRFEQVDNKFEGIDSRLTRVEKIVTNIEHKHGEKLEALFDGRTQDSRRLDIMDGKIDTLQKSVNDLSIRALLTDNKLIELSNKVKQEREQDLVISN